MVIIAVEKAAFLLTVYRVIGCIEVQNQAFGRTTERGDELIDQDLMETPGRRPIRAVLPAAQGRGAGQCRVALDGVCRARSFRNAWWSLRSS